MATAETHYLADIAAGDIPKGSLGVYGALWAMTPNPFEVSPTVAVSVPELCQLTKTTRRAVFHQLAKLDDAGLITRCRHGRSNIYTLHRPAPVREIPPGPFTLQGMLVALAPHLLAHMGQPNNVDAG